MFDLDKLPVNDDGETLPEDLLACKKIAVDFYQMLATMASYTRSKGDSFYLEASFDQEKGKVNVVIETGMYAPMGHLRAEWSADTLADVVKKMDEFPEGEMED